MSSGAFRDLRLAGMIAAILVALPFQLVAEQVFPDLECDRIGLDGDAPDARSLVATDLGDALLLDVELTDPDMAAELTGLIEIDTSAGLEDPASEALGAASRISLLCPKPTGLAVNRTLDLFSRNGAEVPVRDSQDEIIGLAHWEETSTGFALTLDKHLIGVEVGLIEMALVVGTPEAASDCIPDGGEFTLARIDLHRVIVEAATGPDGMIEPAGSIVAEVDQTMSFDLIPDSGYEITSVAGSCGGTLDVDDLTFTTDPITEACNVEASFAIKGHTVSTEANNGKITSDIDPVIEHGQNTVVTGTADVGHHFNAVSGCGGTPQSNTDQTVTEFSYTTGEIVADCTVAAEFAINTYRLGGTVSGLSGNGLKLELDAGELIAIDDDGAFMFDTRLEHGTPWSVSVAEQPTDPDQTCTVVNGSGTIAGATIDNIIVDCTTIALDLGIDDVRFGELQLDDSAEQAVVITNVGGTDLVIEEFAAPALPFGFEPGSCTALPRTLGPGDSCTVMLHFSPLTEGTFEDQLLVVSSTPASPHGIALTGRGVQRAIPVPTLGPLALLILMLGILVVTARSRPRSRLTTPE